jgi:hypothetical protein
MRGCNELAWFMVEEARFWIELVQARLRTHLSYEDAAFYKRDKTLSTTIPNSGANVRGAEWRDVGGLDLPPWDDRR